MTPLGGRHGLEVKRSTGNYEVCGSDPTHFFQQPTYGKSSKKDEKNEEV